MATPAIPPARAPTGVLCEVLEDEGSVERAEFVLESAGADWEGDNELEADETVAS